MKIPNTDTANVLTLTKIVLWLILIVGTVLILKFFGNLLKPLVIALILWYIIRILGGAIAWITLGKFHMPNWLAKLLSFLIIVSAVFFSVEIILLNLRQIITEIDTYSTNQNSLVSRLSQYLGADIFSVDIKEIPRSNELRPLITGIINSITDVIGYSIIIAIYLIFLLLEELMFQKKFHKIYHSQKNYNEMRTILTQMNNSIKRYLSVKTLASFLTALLAYIVMLILGVKFPLLWSFIIFALNYIPYIGSFIATLLPSAYAALQFNSLSSFFLTFLLIQAIQTLVSNFIEPRIVGKSLNLSPLVVFITLTVWGSIWGILGMIIAVPLTSIMVIVMAQFKNTRSIAILLSETGDINKMIVQEAQ